MRHRAELLGGTFEAVTDAGAFDIRVRIPTAVGA
jgi:signal transduction histidine kinase